EAETSRFYGTATELLAPYAWYVDNSQHRTWPVGQKKPNDFGLFDGLGNVWQWCQEGYAPYRQGARGQPVEDRDDIRDKTNQIKRSLRGGAYFSDPSHVRAASRGGDRPSYRDPTVGLRVARTRH